MHKVIKAFYSSVMVVWCCLAQPCFAKTDTWQLNMYQGVTPISHDMYWLHMVAMAICAVIGVGVFGVMFYSLIYHRKARNYKPATFHDNNRLEIVWTIIPFLILVALAVPATQVLMRMDDTEDAAVTIKITGYQWKWQYQYLNEGISFFSNLATPPAQIENKAKKGEWYLLEVDKPLVLPVNKKVRFLVTSNDVIHSWWVPELGVKRDAIPGFMYEAWAQIEKPGTYRGQCTELCGINHGYMPIVVQALNDDDYAKWVEAQPKVVDSYNQTTTPGEPPADMSRAALMEMGKDQYERQCAVCHRADGKGLPPMYPALKGSSVAVGHPISRHIDMILNGIPGTGMQAYKDQLSDAEIAAIVTYERNAWENNTDDVVQPKAVFKRRHINTAPPKMVNKARAGGLR